jgi:hypothetical protein
MSEGGSDSRTVVEFLVGFWFGAGAIYLSWRGTLPAIVFVPDGILSILAAFAAGFGYSKAATVLGYLALILLPIGLILFLQQSAGA